MARPETGSSGASPLCAYEVLNQSSQFRDDQQRRESKHTSRSLLGEFYIIAVTITSIGHSGTIHAEIRRAFQHKDTRGSQVRSVTGLCDVASDIEAARSAYTPSSHW